MRATDTEKAAADQIWSLFLREDYDKARGILDGMLQASNHPRFRRIEARFLLFEGKEAEAKVILADIIEDAWKPGAWELALAGVPIGRAKILDKQKILFFPVRKCGCTSILNLLKVVEGAEMRGEHIHQEDTHNQPVRFDALGDKYADYYSCALVRAPMERLVSYHQGNIVARDQLAVHHDGASEFYGVSTRPSWDAFMKNLNRYRQVFVTARNHTDPVVSFLGKDPGRYSWVGGMADLPALVSILSEKTGKNLPKLAEMASPKPASDLPEMPAEHVALYKDDFEVFGRYF